MHTCAPARKRFLCIGISHSFFVSVVVFVLDTLCAFVFTLFADLFHLLRLHQLTHICALSRILSIAIAYRQHRVGAVAVDDVAMPAMLIIVSFLWCYALCILFAVCAFASLICFSSGTNGGGEQAERAGGNVERMEEKWVCIWKRSQLRKMKFASRWTENISIKIRARKTTTGSDHEFRRIVIIYVFHLVGRHSVPLVRRGVFQGHFSVSIYFVRSRDCKFSRFANARHLLHCRSERMNSDNFPLWIITVVGRSRCRCLFRSVPNGININNGMHVTTIRRKK